MARAAAVLLAAAVVAAGAIGCKRKHVPVESAVVLPYPSCEAGAPEASELVARGRLRGLPDSMAVANALEAFSFTRRGCLLVGTARLEWARGATDLEIVYDAATLAPLRAWKRVTAPPWKHGDVRRYELRTPEVTLTKRVGTEPAAHELLRGARPTVILAPGRGLLTAWLRKARLAVGEKTRETALDLREGVEILREVTLRREEDRDEPSLGSGRRVRVYTIYGREPFFADDDDVVVGDLAGLRPSAAVYGPEPPPLPMWEPLDSRTTP